MSAHQLIRKQAAQHDLYNRLHSIVSEQNFVQRVQDVWYEGRFVVVANQRCGIWYCTPEVLSGNEWELTIESTASAYAYFKSTDGHTSIWSFSLRRSNLPFAAYAEREGGVILVDATRRGKRMPDALSKTVPIWCTVINRAIALRRRRQSVQTSKWDEELYTPPQIVSASEKTQIEARIDGWASELEASSLPLPDLSKPLRPFFLHPGTTVPPFIPPRVLCPFTPIMCLSASQWISKDSDQSYLIGRSLGCSFEYIMGSGDDEELWGRGLTSSLYHRHRDELLAASRENLPSVVDRVVAEAKLLNVPAEKSDEDEELVEAHGVPSPNSPIGIALPVPGGSSWFRTGVLPLVLTIIPCKVPPRAMSQSQTRLIAVSSAKTHGAEFSQALSLIHSLASDAGTSGQRVALRPGAPSDFAVLRASLETDSVATPFQGDLEAFDKAAAEGVVLAGIVLLMLAVDDEGRPRTEPTTTWRELSVNASSYASDEEAARNALALAHVDLAVCECRSCGAKKGKRAHDGTYETARYLRMTCMAWFVSSFEIPREQLWSSQ